jgi:hypothetical protein
MSLLPYIVLVVGLLAVPTGLVLGMGLWTRWLRGRGTVPPYAVTAARFAVLAAGGLVVATAVGLLRAVYLAQSVAPTDKARRLGEEIAPAMNVGALVLPVVLVGAVWLGFCSWKWRPKK